MSRNTIRCFYLGLLGILFLDLGGCATRDERAAIELGWLRPVGARREGRILVRTLEDRRPANHSHGIGEKRHFVGVSGGLVYHRSDASLEEVLTEHVVTTLKHVGYEVELEKAPSSVDESRFDGILEGDIEEFWMNMYIRGWVFAHFRLRLIDPKYKTVVWERRVTGRESIHVGMGSAEGFEEVISLALTEALNEAARDFSSSGFYRRLKKQ